MLLAKNAGASNKALQSDKVNLSCLLLSQKSRQFAFAAELNRYVALKDEE
jgi:hypothetical protein